MDKAIITKLIEEAIEAKKNSYSPYSNFAVGAAILCSDGKIYRGCNIENAAYPTSICAERVALFKAISEGERDFMGIAIISNSGDITPPCGACRQALSEFAKNDFKVILATSINEYKIYDFTEILPLSFKMER